MNRFFITAKENIPLLKLLSMNLPGQYNAEVIIASGGAWKDKKRVTNTETIIHAQETIKVHIGDIQGKFYTLSKEQVIFENDDLLVVYKPCDLNVHAVPTSIHYHLSHGVDGYLHSQGISFEPTPITRLDRAVEGLVLFAKNKPAERKLFELTKKRKIKKWYMAALEKRNENPKCLRIQDTIGSNGSRTLLDSGGKASDSLFIKTASLETADIYSVFIFTGRRHQIRFHASHYISPIFGDTLYGSSVSMPPDQIALMCRGYNIPYRKKILHIRLPQEYINHFYQRIS
ncbi:MAG: RNA pseudouridine synthase [Acidobacteria bacterium]|jgi:23S rRNA-/tRNA-specific pseudouridylate synthase|nr:RNA pseudouridine synthase [Acidobacteriota bacterium]